MSDPVLDVSDLCIDLGRGSLSRPIVRNLSFQIHPGETLCLVGESGSGKSLTSLSVMGLLPEALKVSGGIIKLGKRDILGLPGAALRDLRGSEMAMIFQEPMTALNPIMRIGDQIAEVFRVHGRLAGRARSARCIELLEEVGLPDPPKIVRSYPHELSGGQRQRVMIAMALALEPRLLIADEPTTALDVTTQAQVLALIDRLRKKHGTSVLFITHDFGVVADISDRVVVLRHGEAVEAGTARSVLDHPQHEYTRKLLDAVPTLDLPPARPLSENTAALEVTSLQKHYRKRALFGPGRLVHAVNDVSFSIRQGEVLGLVGESGSGKSTVGRCIMQLTRPDGGGVKFGTTALDITAPMPRPVSRRVQMVFQDPFGSLNPRHPVGKIIAEGMIAHGTPRRAALEEAVRLLERVGLPAAAAERLPKEFSGGQRQRIAIARALALKPEVLIADEPVSALDVSIQAQILTLFKELRDSLGLSILFITHDLRVAVQMCDRIAVMQKGRLVELETAHTLLESPQSDYTKRLFAAIPGRLTAAS